MCRLPTGDTADSRATLLDDLDNFIKIADLRNVIKTAELDNDAREFLARLSEALKEKSARVSPIDLARLAGLAFQMTFAGTRREDKLGNALARGLSVREKMAAEEGGSMSAEETARYLGVTKQSVLNLYHAGKVLGWRTEKQGAVRFPVWQFAEHGRLPGLDEVLGKLNRGQALDDWGRIGFFLQTHALLDGRRPLDLIREKKVDRVLMAAEAYVE